MLRKELFFWSFRGWQLGDLAGKGLLQLDIAMLTNLKFDHLNYYKGNLRHYAEDKSIIFSNLHTKSYALLDLDDRTSTYFIPMIHGGVSAFYSREILSSLYSDGLYWRDERTLVLRQSDVEKEYLMDKIPLGILRENIAKAMWIVLLLIQDKECWNYDLEDYSGLMYRCQLIDSDANHRF